MRDVLVVTGVIAFFALGAAYIALCARILADAGDIDEAIADEPNADGAEAHETNRHEVDTRSTVGR
jgi:hypothetical protein